MYHNTDLIQIDIDANEIGRNFPVAMGAVADIRHAARQLGEAAASAPARDWSELGRTIARARQTIWSETAERGALNDFPLKPERILEDVRRNLPANTIFCTDVGWNKNGVAQRYLLPDDGIFITPGGLATMGFGPAAAIGAKYGARDRPVVALIGDGAMSSQLSAVPTAVEQGIQVIWVVMNNSAYGTIADLEKSHYGVQYGTVFKDPDGKPYTPDFAALARSCGAWGTRVNSAAELAGALQEALAAGGRRSSTSQWSTTRYRHQATGTSTTSTAGSSRRSVGAQVLPRVSDSSRPQPSANGGRRRANRLCVRRSAAQSNHRG